MADNGIGDYFIRDIEDEVVEEDDAFLAAQVVVPAAGVVTDTVASPVISEPNVVSPGHFPSAEILPSVAAEAPAAVPAPAPMPAPTAAPSATVIPAGAAMTAVRPQATARQATREERLAVALDTLMAESSDVQAAALVSLDGFTMASALPPGMQEDRVGAMSAAILALGERAATELGRGRLSQVFIEGADGYVLLMASGSRSVLTVLADRDAKLGLVLYDMRHAAEAIGEIVG